MSSLGLGIIKYFCLDAEQATMHFFRDHTHYSCVFKCPKPHLLVGVVKEQIISHQIHIVYPLLMYHSFWI